ncbi:MAG: GNAT family N-acetyltransferase [Chloroflexota bacterium]
MFQITLQTSPQPPLEHLIARLDQADNVAFQADWHLQSHLLVASKAGLPVGFLRYVLQQIGVEEDLEPIQLAGIPLTEAKVLAFGVAPEQRRQGIGRALQLALIEQSQRAGCYQIRSHSATANQANHQLKLSLGFAVHPLISSANKDGCYFILPLQK